MYTITVRNRRKECNIYFRTPDGVNKGVTGEEVKIKWINNIHVYMFLCICILEAHFLYETKCNFSFFHNIFSLSQY